MHYKFNFIIVWQNRGRDFFELIHTQFVVENKKLGIAVCQSIAGLVEYNVIVTKDILRGFERGKQNRNLKCMLKGFYSRTTQTCEQSDENNRDEQ